MAEVQTTRSWAGRVLFVAVSVTILLAQLLPLTTQPRGWAPPDMLLALTFVWVVRRPDLTPVLLVAAIHFLADILLQRPPGLWSALVIITTEILRHRAPDLRPLAFPFEWITASVALIGLNIAYRVVLFVLVLPQAPLMLTLIQLVMTILAYPLVVLVSYLAFGVSRPALGEVDERGRRL